MNSTFYAKNTMIEFFKASQKEIKQMEDRENK
jgi:hypothetical protein